MVVAMHDLGQKRMASSGEEKQQGDACNSAEGNRNDTNARVGARLPARVVTALQQRVADHEERKTGVAENIKPRARLSIRTN